MRNQHFRTMPALKIVLRKKANKDGTYPLALRITKDRTSSYIYVGHNLHEAEWDAKQQKVKKSHPNSVRLNNLLLQKMAEQNNKLLELETQNNDTSSRAIKNGLISTHAKTFFKQADIYKDNLKKNGKFNRLSADAPRIERFKEFLKDNDLGDDISFQEINVGIIKRFRAYLNGTRDITERTIVNHLIVIRTIFNQAVAANVVDRKYYPFGKGKVVIKFPDTLKIGLTANEIKVIEGLELAETSIPHHARNIWLFAFYFAGMRASDVLRLKWVDFQDDRLHYSMGKNDKVGSLKVPEKALRIMNQYKREKPVHDLVFPDLENVENLNDEFKTQKKIAQAIKRIDKYLQEVKKKAGITKPLTMHIGRHSFGNISGDKIPVQMLQKLYRHTSITTTIGYQGNFIHKDADDALEAVIGT